PLQHDGDIYMGAAEDFDDLKGQYAETIEDVQARIARLPEGERAANERRLNDIQVGLRRMQPLGLRSVTLEQQPSEGGIYSETNINSELVGRLQDGSTRAQIDNALRGTGISADTVVNRIETGAPNAALERQWVAGDLAKVADAQGLNLERKHDLEVARERLNQVHVELGTVLERAEVLREDGVIEEAREIRFHFDQERLDDTTRAVRQDLRGQGVNEAQLEARAIEIENRAFDRMEAEQRDYLAPRPEILSDPQVVYRTDEEGRGRIADQELADRIDREIEVILDRAPANQSISEAVASDFKERYPDMPDHLARGLGDTYETSFRLNNAQELREAELEAAESATARERALSGNRLNDGMSGAGVRIENEEIRRVVEHERSDDVSPSLATDEQRLSYREQIEQELDDAQIGRLRDGDSDALENLSDDRLDRLYAAKAYLQSDAATANSEAYREVVQEIADEQYELQKDRLVDSECEAGPVHG
ncbi:MAG: endonuclease, partial [Pseudomonadota bacterium]